MKILFYIMSLDGGGAEKVLVNLCNQLLEKYNNYDITVQTLFDVGINKKNLSDRVRYKSNFNHVFRGNKHFFKLFSPNFLYRKLIKEEYDIVVSFCQGPTTRIISGHPKDTCSVQWIHNEFKEIREISSSYRSIQEAIKCMQSFDKTVYVAETVKISFEKLFPDIKNGITLYNINDKENIIEKSNLSINNSWFNNNRFHLVSVGRLVPQKSFDRLIDIMNKLINNDKLEVDLIILGEGHLKTNLENQIDKYNLKNYINLFGYDDNPYKYVKNADLFVCSSLHEGYSTAVTESILVGTPVITTKCSGMEELLGTHGEYGIIVENEINSLYMELKKIILSKNELNDLKNKTKKRKNQLIKRDELFLINNFFKELWERGVK